MTSCRRINVWNFRRMDQLTTHSGSLEETHSLWSFTDRNPPEQRCSTTSVSPYLNLALVHGTASTFPRMEGMLAFQNSFPTCLFLRRHANQLNHRASYQIFSSIEGRFLALCGFQSLSGDVDFWDRVEEKLVGRAKMTHTTSFSWSACSRYVVASSTFPRLRVDNGTFIGNSFSSACTLV